MISALCLQTLNDMKKFFVYKISTEPFLPEIVTGLLWELNISGLTEADNEVIAFAAENSGVHKEEVGSLLEKIVSQKLINSFSVTEDFLEDKNWNELWEKEREVIRISDRIIIKPSFKEYTTKPNEIVLTIDPKMSFGTGEHQTTKLVLRQLEKYVTDGMRILDVGSGTGILAVAAIKLGANYAVAVDNDELCYENCKENCIVNNVIEKVKIVCGEIKDINENDFDIITANIQADVLVDIANEIKARAKKEGIIILSGLLKSDEYEIIKCYVSLNFNFVGSVLMLSASSDEWIAIVFQLKN